MTRELRVTLAIMAIALVASAPLIFADAPTSQPTSSYLALVFQDIPTPTPTPVPTPVPPPLQTLVIQLRDMASGFTQEEFGERTNAASAQTYADPKAALKAFQAQGRETSWFTSYFSTQYLVSDAIGVANQVYRYSTAAGAAQGQAYTLAEAVHDHPDYRPFNITTPCCPTTGYKRTFSSGGVAYTQYLISVQIGRYVTDTQVIGLAAYLDLDTAIKYAQITVSRIYDTPQAITATDISVPVSPAASDITQSYR